MTVPATVDVEVTGTEMLYAGRAPVVGSGVTGAARPAGRVGVRTLMNGSPTSLALLGAGFVVDGEVWGLYASGI